MQISFKVLGRPKKKKPVKVCFFLTIFSLVIRGAAESTCVLHYKTMKAMNKTFVSMQEAKKCSKL